MALGPNVHIRRVNHPRYVFQSGALYTLGRALAYVALGSLLLAGLAAMDEVSRFLQKYMNQILGPALILVGMILLQWLAPMASFNLTGDRIQKRAAEGGSWWAFPLGILFALSFCPVSAGLFFGGLIPLSIKAESPVLLPALFGLGTALPVIVFAFLVAFASRHVGKAYDRLARIEKVIRPVVGTIFILAGIYYTLAHIYGIQI